MEPTFLPGDILVVEGGLAGLQRGSIFAIDWQKWTADLGPNAPERVIGMPGDHVQLQNGRVVLNGAPLGESFGPTEPVPDGPSEWVVPPGQVFVLADGRPNAADSRVYGFVPFAALIGRVSFRCAPDDRRGPIAHLDGMTFANAD
jgi:signal peptidase I